MATYGHRSSQRLRRDEPVVASSSRHHASSSRRDAEAGSSSTTHPTTSAQSIDEGDDDDAEFFDGALLQPILLNVTDTARKQAEQVGQAEIDKKGAQLARYALACEYKRMPIRKEDIRKDVLDPNTTRCFIPVFNAAQKMLHRTFGYLMVEVRPKGADNAELAKQAQEVLRAATSSANGLRPRGQPRDDPSGADGPQASNIWTLQSALPAQVNKALVKADDELTKIYAQANPTNASTPSSTRRRQAESESKSVIDWKAADRQDGEMGLLYIILALILVNGRTITDGEYRYRSDIPSCQAGWC